MRSLFCSQKITGPHAFVPTVPIILRAAGAERRSHIAAARRRKRMSRFKAAMYMGVC